MKRKIITKILAVILAFCMSVIFVGCGQSKSVSGPIPNGRYAYAGGDWNVKTYIYTDANPNELELYWQIEGDYAESWCSGLISSKAKIVEKEGEIYFECYEWVDIVDIISVIGLFFGEKLTKSGSTNIYLVEYNAEEKNITVDYRLGE